ncbi:MAG: TRAP transporter substrate-binding protein DctP, partial [Planctomycetales bacterium]|nr:TRAP transporter substrate-binding protein DctP [Planctomycetales bacterium]
VPQIAVFGVPYAFRDGEHFWRFADSEAGQDLLAAGEPLGLRGLCYYDAGSRNFYTVDRPILAPSDLNGLKIRVQQSQTAIAMVEALGGSPTPIAWGELYSALQQSMVDGAENNPPSFYSNRHFEVCKHLTMDEHTRVPDVLLISAQVWSRLTPQQQNWLQQAAQASSQFERKLWAEESARVLDAVKSEGVTVHYPDKTAFATQVQAMHAGYQGSDIGALLQIISDM